MALLALWGAPAAKAAGSTADFDIPATSLTPALTAFAVQAEVSISLRGVERCRGPSRSIKGRYAPQAALRAMLAGTGCGFRMLDARAFELAPSGQAETAPPPRSNESSRAPAEIAPATVDVAEVVAVATRRPTAIDRLAYSVSAIGARLLEAQGVSDMGGIAALAPSMVVTNLGLGRDKIVLRGLSDGPLTGKAQSMVGLYLDNTRLTYNAPDPDLRLVDVASVEVLRGPQAAQYGSGSLGGVVHVVTRSPDPKAFFASVGASAAAGAGSGGSGVLEAVVNLPLAHGRAAARLVGYQEIQGGYINDPVLGLGHVNRGVRQGGRLALMFDLGGGWVASPGIVTQSINDADTQYAVAGLAPYSRDVRLREPHDNDFDEEHLDLRGPLPLADLRWTTSLIQHSLVSRYDASTAPPVATPVGPDAYDETLGISTVLTEATLVSRRTRPVAWTAGLFYAHTDQTADSALTELGATPVTAFAWARRDHLDEAAIFGETQVSLGERTSLTIGGRLFTYATRTASAASEGQAFSGRRREAGFAPKVVLAYAPARSALVYVQAAEGYRAGGFNTTAPPGQAFSAPGGRAPNRLYDGDELWSFEAGAKVAFLQDRARLRLAGFEAFWKNIQSDQLLASGLPFTVNIGNGRNQGVELEGALRLGELELDAEALADAPELSQPNRNFPAVLETGLSAAPDVSGGASAHYQRPLGDDRSIALDARWAYVGGSQLVLEPSTITKMGGYATTRLAVTFTIRGASVALAADNLADAYGDTFAFGNPFTVRAQRQITPMRPRTLTLTLKAAF